MLSTGAIINGDSERLLGFSQVERPLAIQIGGSDPKALARAARIGECWGYDEINLNCGCPSERVRRGAFGAALMADPDHARNCVAEMVEAVSIPVTVKCRTGLDTHPDCLDEFVDAVAAAGCRTVIVHARLALTGGISPKDNRSIPPLRPQRVRALKKRRPDLTVLHNGGIASMEEAEAVGCHLDGVMIGRAAYRTPAILGYIDSMLAKDISVVDPVSAARRHRAYLADGLRAGVPFRAMTRHMLGLFAGHPGARCWRSLLSVGDAPDGPQAIALYDKALDAILSARAMARPAIPAVSV